MWLYVPSVSAQESRALESVSSLPLSSSSAKRLSRSCTWKGKATLPRYWSQGWRRDPWLRLLSGATLPRCFAARAALTWLKHQPTSGLEESPASPGALPANRKERMTIATFGRMFGARWRSWLLVPSSWKTSQDSLFGTDSDESQETYRRWVTGWQQSCSRLRTLVRATAVSGSSSWHTAKVASGGYESLRGEVILTLQGAAQSWGTPRVGTNEGLPCPASTGNGSRIEDQAVMWMTPRATRVPESMETVDARRAKQEAEMKAGGFRYGGNLSIDTQAATWYTPNVPNGGRKSPGIVENKGKTEKGKRQVGLENQVGAWTLDIAPSVATQCRPSTSETTSAESASENWPTPDANATTRTNKSLSEGSTIRPALALLAQQWPTPKAWDGRRETEPTPAELSRDSLDLKNAAPIWSTPRGTDGEKGGPNQTFGAGGVPLPAQAFHFSPPDQQTPDGQTFFYWTRELRRQYRLIRFLLGLKRVLNPTFAEWLMSLPPQWSCAGIGFGPSETEWFLYKQRSASCLRILLSQEPNDG